MPSYLSPRDRAIRSALEKGPSSATFVYKVLKQVHPDTGISRAAMSVAVDLLSNVAQDLIAEVRHLRDVHNRAVVTAREVQTAVRLVFPGELAKHAVSEGTKAVCKYGSGRGGARTARAGLQFSVPRVDNWARGMLVDVKLSGSMAPYLAAVLEYTAAEILELAGNAAKDMRMRRITPRHVTLALRGDEELDKLFKGTVARGGVIPHIHKSLMPAAKGKGFGATGPPRPVTGFGGGKKSSGFGGGGGGGAKASAFGGGFSFAASPASPAAAPMTASTTFAAAPAAAPSGGGFSFSAAGGGGGGGGFTFGNGSPTAQPTTARTLFGGGGSAATPGGPDYQSFDGAGGAGGGAAPAYDTFDARTTAPPAAPDGYDRFDFGGAR